MKALDLPGHWEPDARPDGGYVAPKLGDRVLSTHLGTLVCPDTPRYPRLTTTGPVRIAVQGDGRTREWDGATWLIHREACGSGGPVIYDAAGIIRIADCAQVGSQGYRYVAPDGTLVTGDQSRVRAGSELLESTYLGDGIVVGQGPHGGCWAQLPDGYREIGPGIAMVIRAARVGSDVAIAWYEPDVPTRGSATAHLRWYRVDELRALPRVATTMPPVTYAPVVSPGRALWMGFYEFQPGHVLPANSRIPSDLSKHLSDLIVEGPDWYYVAGNPDGDIGKITAAIATARTHQSRPVAAYIPRGVFDRAEWPAVLRGLNPDIAGIECYLGVDESDAEFLARRSRAIRECTRVVLVSQCYSSNDRHTRDLRRLPGLVSQLARDHAQVEMIVLFSGPGRQTGWADHPEVHDAWWQFFRLIPGVPKVLPAEPREEYKTDTDTPPPVVVVPKPKPPSWVLPAGDDMLPGDELRSADGTVRLIFQADRNLVVYERGVDNDEVAMWATGTGDDQPDILLMQDDGNCCLYRGIEPVWASGTAGHPGARLEVRETACIVAPDGEVLWRAQALTDADLDAIFGPPPPPVVHRPSKPIGGNAIVGFFRALAQINFRKWFR